MIIIATVEKYLLTKDHIKKLILTGTDALRFNFSYRSIEENLEYISIAQQVIDELNTSVKIFIDFPINKYRLGDFELKLFPVNEGDEITLKSGAFTFDCDEYIPVRIPNLGDKLREDQSVTIGDGEISVIITKIIDSDTVSAKVQNKGVIQYMKTFNLALTIDEEEILKQYSEILKKIKNVDHHYIAISYFNDALFDSIRNVIEEEKIKTKIVLKIENEFPITKIEEICQKNNFDIMLLDRGELGVNMPYYKIGIYQKNILKIAQKYKKQVIITTQILESTINNYIPNRAEILDLTNIILDGVSGIMLCRETAINPRAAYTVSVAKKIISEIEKQKKENTII